MSEIWNKKNIHNIVEAIRHNEGKCVFLVGAGCSKSAGIPLAREIISEIEKDFPAAYSQASDRFDYNDVMTQLHPQQRRTLLNKHIEKAKVNWAHLALAQLFKEKLINRVLTTNFDPLIVKATALTGFFPAIYDLATSNQFKPNRISPNSIFYLNGQHTGFVTLNATEELDEHKAQLTEIVKNTGVERTWIVIGYSGAADPLLDVLAEVPEFEAGLYWVGYDENPSEHLEEKLLKQAGKQAFYLGNHDADEFMTKLAQELGCFPPKLLSAPFQHVNHLIEHIDFKTGGVPGQALKEQLDKQLSHAQSIQIKTATSEYAVELLLAGKNKEVLEWYATLVDSNDDDKDLAAWAYVQIGVILARDAAALAGSDPIVAQLKWDGACQKYAQALEIKPDKHEALNNWGSALAEQARVLASSDLTAARSKWDEAGQKYVQALKIKPDKHEALNNWGNALAVQASALASNDLAAARTKWDEAGQKYAQALEIKPDKHETLNNWGNALVGQASAIVSNDLNAARSKWDEAGQKYAQASEIKPDKYEALSNWGNALADQASSLVSNDPIAAQLKWDEAGQKYAQALEIKPDNHEAFNNWGSALAEQARKLASSDSIAAQLKWEAACQKYEQALEIKPDKYNAIINWGTTLTAQAAALVSDNLIAARLKWDEADQKYAQAIEIKPNECEGLVYWTGCLLEQYHFCEDEQYQKSLLTQAEQLMLRAREIDPNKSAYNLACVYALKNELVKCLECLEQSRLAGELPSRKHIDNEKDFKLIRNTKEFEAWYNAAFSI